MLYYTAIVVFVLVAGYNSTSLCLLLISQVKHRKYLYDGIYNK